MVRSMLRLLLIIVAAIADFVRRRQTRRELEEVQREQDAISDDPAGWIIDHFGGVPSDDADGADSVPDEAEDHD